MVACYCHDDITIGETHVLAIALAFGYGITTLPDKWENLTIAEKAIFILSIGAIIFSLYIVSVVFAYFVDTFII